MLYIKYHKQWRQIFLAKGVSIFMTRLYINLEWVLLYLWRISDHCYVFGVTKRAWIMQSEISLWSCRVFPSDRSTYWVPYFIFTEGAEYTVLPHLTDILCEWLDQIFLKDISLPSIKKMSTSGLSFNNHVHNKTFKIFCWLLTVTI